MWRDYEGVAVSVPDWHDDARQAMQALMSSAETIKVYAERGISGPDMSESVSTLTRNVERLDKAFTGLRERLGAFAAIAYVVGKAEPRDVFEEVKLVVSEHDAMRSALTRTIEIADETKTLLRRVEEKE